MYSEVIQSKSFQQFRNAAIEMSEKTSVYKKEDGQVFVAEGKRATLYYYPLNDFCSVLHNQSIHQVGDKLPLEKGLKLFGEMEVQVSD